MAGRRVLLIHNLHGWYWGDIEQRVRATGLVEAVDTTNSRREALELIDRHMNQDDVVLSQPLLQGRSLAALFSKVRVELGFQGPIYIIGDRIDREVMADLIRVDVDGLIRPAELPGAALGNLLQLLVTGSVRIATRDIGMAFYRQLTGVNPLGHSASDLSTRQVAILRAIYTQDGYTDAAIAKSLGIHPSTLKRDLDAIRDVFGKRDRLAIGVEAARRGIVP